LIHFYKRILNISVEKMQIFVLNIEGKTITLDVDPVETIRMVKEKLEVKIGVPAYLQRLVYNGKPILDQKTLQFYSIGKESNLRLNLQTWNRSSVIHGGPSFDWDNLANKVKSKVDKEIDEKKAVYEALMIKKREECKNLDKIKYDIEQCEGLERQADEQILVKDIEIQNFELKLKEAKKQKIFLKDQRDGAIMKRSRKREEIGSLQVKIAKIDEDIKETFVVAGERLSRRNEELVENNSAMKEFLRETISKKESCLECPVCFHISSPPIYKCVKEHLICSNCLPRVNNKCPTCRSGYARTDRIFRLAEENWRELQIMKTKLEEM